MKLSGSNLGIFSLMHEINIKNIPDIKITSNTIHQQNEQTIMMPQINDKMGF